MLCKASLYYEFSKNKQLSESSSQLFFESSLKSILNYSNHCGMAPDLSVETTQVTTLFLVYGTLLICNNL